MTSLKTSIKTITYLSDIGCLEIQGASLALYTVTIRMGEKATFFSLPVSGFADVVEVVVLWFSSGLYSSFWG